MRAMLKLFRSSIAFAVVIPAIAGAEGIPVVGLDKDHHERAVIVSQQDYVTAVSDVINNVNQSTLLTLQRQDANQGKSSWMLRDVCIGLGFSFEIGLGPIWSLTAAPRVRLGFSNSTHPKIPD